MAAVALNKFLTVRSKATTAQVGIYTCPVGVAAIITLCQVTNVSEDEAYTITGIHSRTDSGAFKFANREEIPVDDSMNLIPDGRLALQTNDVLIFSSNANNKLDIILSILETAKQ